MVSLYSKKYRIKRSEAAKLIREHAKLYDVVPGLIAFVASQDGYLLKDGSKLHVVQHGKVYWYFRVTYP